MNKKRKVLRKKKYMYIGIILFILISNFMIYGTSLLTVPNNVEEEKKEIDLAKVDVPIIKRNPLIEKKEIIDVEIINGVYNIYNGIQPNYKVRKLLTNVIINNRINNMLIKIKSNGKLTNNIEEIIDIQSKLTNTEYYVECDYNIRGYINFIVIK